MTFEGFDAAPLIEAVGISPDMPAIARTAFADDSGTLDAALREAARAERAATRAELFAADLWIGHGDARGLGASERPGLEAGTSWRALMPLLDDAVIELPGGKAGPLRAAFGEQEGGGYGEKEEEIIVKGTRPDTMDEDDDFGWGWLPNDNDGDPPGPGGGGLSSNQQKEDADETPCVNEVPAGADINEINDLAKFMGTRLAGLQDSTGWEWGAFIYRAPDGQLYQSEPFTAQHHGDMNGAVGHVPPGSHIVGYIHTHPIDVDLDQRTLSSVDRQFIDTLVGMTGGVTADANLLTYVTTKDKDLGYSDAYSTFVYDKSNRSSTSPGCDL